MSANTLYDKIWDSHVVTDYGDGEALLYIDRDLAHEVASPQAFEGLKARGLPFRRPEAHLAVADHAVPTQGRNTLLKDSLAAQQIARLVDNCGAFDVPYIPIDDDQHGIVHVTGPETGFTLPGTTLVCGDSHTSTQTISLNDITISFDVASYGKELLLSGLDETAAILANETAAIEAFERNQSAQMPWLYPTQNS